MDIKELSKVDALIESDLVLSFKHDITKRLALLRLAMKSFLVSSEYDLKLYHFNTSDLYKCYENDGYKCIDELVKINVSDRSKEDQERYTEYLLLSLALESLRQNKCKDALSLYKDASLCGTNLTPIERRERIDKRLFTTVAREVCERDVSHILMPAHVIKLAKSISGITRSDKVLRRWLDDELVLPIEVLEKIADNKIPKDKESVKQRNLLVDLIYDELKDYSNEV